MAWTSTYVITMDQISNFSCFEATRNPNTLVVEFQDFFSKFGPLWLHVGLFIYHVVSEGGGGFTKWPWLTTRGKGNQNDHVVTWTTWQRYFALSDQKMQNISVQVVHVTTWSFWVPSPSWSIMVISWTPPPFADHVVYEWPLLMNQQNIGSQSIYSDGRHNRG